MKDNISHAIEKRIDMSGAGEYLPSDIYSKLSDLLSDLFEDRLEEKISEFREEYGAEH